MWRRLWGVWRMRGVWRVADTAYAGRYAFNKKNMRTGETKPEEEWVVVPIPALIDKQVFDAVAHKRHMRSPAVTPARLVSSPTLLTSLLKCDNCGAGMTTATGKGGRYRYYKCNTRIGQHNRACCTPAISMPKLDKLVLEAFTDKVLSPERLRAMLKEMKGHLKNAKARQDESIRSLQRELNELETATNRLYEAVERDLLPMDEMLRDRAQKLKSRREAILIQIAGARRQAEMPLSTLTGGQLDAFGAALRTRLMDTDTGPAKRYLRELVSEIRFDGKRVVMRGKKAALLAAARHQTKKSLKLSRSMDISPLRGIANTRCQGARKLWTCKVIGDVLVDAKRPFCKEQNLTLVQVKQLVGIVKKLQGRCTTFIALEVEPFEKVVNDLVASLVHNRQVFRQSGMVCFWNLQAHAEGYVPFCHGLVHLAIVQLATDRLDIFAYQFLFEPA